MLSKQEGLEKAFYMQEAEAETAATLSSPDRLIENSDGIL